MKLIELINVAQDEEMDIKHVEYVDEFPTYVIDTITAAGKKHFSNVLNSEVVSIVTGNHGGLLVYVAGCKLFELDVFLENAAGYGCTCEQWDKWFSEEGED